MLLPPTAGCCEELGGELKQHVHQLTPSPAGLRCLGTRLLELGSNGNARSSPRRGENELEPGRPAPSITSRPLTVHYTDRIS